MRKTFRERHFALLENRRFCRFIRLTPHSQELNPGIVALLGKRQFRISKSIVCMESKEHQRMKKNTPPPSPPVIVLYSNRRGGYNCQNLLSSPSASLYHVSITGELSVACVLVRFRLPRFHPNRPV